MAINAVTVTTLLISPTSIVPENPTRPLAIPYVTMETAKSVAVRARNVIKISCVLVFG